MENKCERCGYIASSKVNLIKHVKDERICRPILSSISHIDLLNKLQPPPDLTCKFCNLLCKTKTAHTTHIKYHCHLNPDRVDRKRNKNDVASTSNEDSQINRTKNETCIRKYFHRHTSTTNGLYFFNKDINWSEIHISNDTLLKCIINTKQGIVDLFILLHSHDKHKNIEWLNDKLIIFDGKGWTELDDDLLAKHLGFLYSYLEEHWCDYLMNVRCETTNAILDEEVVESIDDFMYNQIVDDESVLFQCGDVLLEYLETLKTC
jgi:hypothetical protein